MVVRIDRFGNDQMSMGFDKTKCECVFIVNIFHHAAGTFKNKKNPKSCTGR
jgi:hypothetical protein